MPETGGDVQGTPKKAAQSWDSLMHAVLVKTPARVQRIQDARKQLRAMRGSRRH